MNDEQQLLNGRQGAAFFAASQIQNLPDNYRLFANRQNQSRTCIDAIERIVLTPPHPLRLMPPQ
jgi:hypothetical protein